VEWAFTVARGWGCGPFIDFGSVYARRCRVGRWGPLPSLHGQVSWKTGEEVRRDKGGGVDAGWALVVVLRGAVLTGQDKHKAPCPYRIESPF